jgi:DNA-binding NtrC family response regulator
VSAVNKTTCTGKVLLIDDDTRLLEMVSLHLEDAGYQVIIAETATLGLAALDREEPTVVVLDLGLPDISGKTLLQQVRSEHPQTAVIMFTARDDFEDVVECMQLGAVDYLPKSADRTRLLTSIRNAMRQAELSARVASLTSELREGEGFSAIIGSSPAIRKSVNLLRRAAQSDVTVLVEGESGTGKELAARAVHAESERCSGPFVAINCGAIPEGLIESELFGHEKGSFTGAVASRQGCFERADGGTIFLDEIGELRADLQVRLLRVLQDGCVQRVGSSAVRQVNMRVVAATNRDLRAEVKAGRFREDLFFRLAVFPITLPPLRERTGDIEILAQAFLEKFSERHKKPIRSFATEALRVLAACPWSGNVRELENIVERAVILEDGSEVSLGSIPPEVYAAVGEAVTQANDGNIPNSAYKLSATIATGTPVIPFSEEERRIILHALRVANWNVQEAAAMLELGRATVYRKIERYGLRQESGKPL